MLNQTGVFILAPNDHSDTLTMAIFSYKAQQNVEQGFHFLKSLGFNLLTVPENSRSGLKKLMMTCSLMIYAALEHRIRQHRKLVEHSI